MNDQPDIAVRDTRRWLERAVIGLNLCPFAKAPYVKQQIHYAVSAAAGAAQLMEDLGQELDSLVAADPVLRETTLLIAPNCLQDFLDFNDFMGEADRLVAARGLEGVIQLASFHPGYQFADARGDDVTNFTNRSPFPTVHLLREASIDRAVEAIAQPESIYETNMATLRQLGVAGWAALGVGSST